MRLLAVLTLGIVVGALADLAVRRRRARDRRASLNAEWELMRIGAQRKLADSHPKDHDRP